MDFDFQNQLQGASNNKNTLSLSLSNTNINSSINNNSNINSSNYEDSHYYQQYCRLFLANIALTNQLKQLIQQKSNLKYRLNKYQDQQGLSSYERNEKNKRFRRNAHEIQRFYKCNVKTCGKSYGSQGSLHQHYKLKHPQIYATLPNVQCANISSIGTISQLNNNSNNHRDIQHFSHSKQQNAHNNNNYTSIFSSNNLLNIQLRDQIKHSNSKINSILKQLGDFHSYKSIKIQQFNLLQMDDNKQNNKQNYYIHNQMNINVNLTQKQMKDQKPQKLNFTRKDQLTIQSIDCQNQNNQLKRSSRTIKKRQLDF